MSAPLRLWLLGAGIAASPSPAMQEAAMTAMGVEGWYRALDVDAAGFREALARLRSGEADGANVTIPYKRAAAAACDRLEGDARALGAVNTLVGRGGELTGHNTDAAGLEAALRHQRLWPAPGQGGFDAVVMGAGGAAAAAGLVLLRAGAARLTVAARRRQAAEETASLLGALAAGGAAVTGASLDDLGRLLPGAGWLVNATPAGAAELGVEVTMLHPSAVVVDLRYRPRPVDLAAAASAAGLRAADGLEMLLRQGMDSLRLWSGRPPAVDAARRALHQAVGA